jgi:hypothetical protein
LAGSVRYALRSCADRVKEWVPNAMIVARLQLESQRVVIVGMDEHPHLRNCLEERLPFVGDAIRSEGVLALRVDFRGKPEPERGATRTSGVGVGIYAACGDE